jgi:magnesium chelatase family protein
VEGAREHQRKRFADYPGIHTNADMGAGEVQKLCVLTDKGRELLEVSVRRMQLSARGYHRVLKLSRTIADLAHSRYIDVQHVAEAIQYRPRDSGG